MSEKISTSNQRVEILPGALAGVIEWPILDQIWRVAQHAEDSKWNVLENDKPLPGASRPTIGDFHGDLASSLNALKDYLRQSHPQRYCGLVFTDSITDPTLIRIFDPKLVTSMCNIYGNTPAPSWVISTMDAAQLAASHKASSILPNHRLGKPLPAAPRHPQVADSLDVRRMGCPLPLLHTARSLRRLAVGEILEIVTIDPGAVNDIAVLCQSTGAKLLAVAEAEHGYSYFIERGPEKKSTTKDLLQ
jgi:TusA-related sulfurtransferase